MNFRFKFNVVDGKGKTTLGPGIVELLKMIDEEKSINKASKRMNLSYVKAIKLLKRLEGNFRNSLMVKKIGGKKGGGTTLTPKGKQIIESYEELLRKIELKCEIEFQKFLKEIEDESQL